MSEYLENYDAFIIDLWGVMHDGVTLYAGAKQVIERMAEEEKEIIFLSNAPRRAQKAIDKLSDFGIPPSLYKMMLTSGEEGARLLSDGVIPDIDSGVYYYLGPSKDEDILDGLAGFEQAGSDDASFILCTGFEYDFQPVEEIQPTLQRLLALELPMVCVNPDLEVVKQDGTQQLCAGAVAADYEALGGVVHYIGKPHMAVYERCFAALNSDRVLAIGDNLLTDILGANHAQIDSLLITGGVLKEALKTRSLVELCEEAGSDPTHIAGSLAEAFEMDG